jgi:hypothetical protein
MGDMVGRKAAAAIIMADVETTYEKAKARGGKWFELAERMLGGPTKMKAALAAQLREAEAELRPLLAAVEAQDEAADKLIGHIADESWNAIGRPAADPTYDVVFPSGIGYYTDGPDAEQPHRMELLAQLLEMNVLTRLPTEQAKSMAARLRESAAAYRQVLEPVAAPRTRVDMLGRASTALAHSSQIALSQLKRLYRGEGFSEAEIHTVIPDRPRKRSSAGTSPSPAPTPSAA